MKREWKNLEQKKLSGCAFQSLYKTKREFFLCSLLLKSLIGDLDFPEELKNENNL